MQRSAVSLLTVTHAATLAQTWQVGTCTFLLSELAAPSECLPVAVACQAQHGLLWFEHKHHMQSCSIWQRYLCDAHCFTLEQPPARFADLLWHRLYYLHASLRHLSPSDGRLEGANRTGFWQPFAFCTRRLVLVRKGPTAMRPAYSQPRAAPTRPRSVLSRSAGTASSRRTAVSASAGPQAALGRLNNAGVAGPIHAIATPAAAVRVSLLWRMSHGALQTRR